MYQVKLEVPSNSLGSLSNGSVLSSPPPAPIQQSSKESANPDDPLAGIINQTIFGGKGSHKKFFLMAGPLSPYLVLYLFSLEITGNGF